MTRGRGKYFLYVLMALLLFSCFPPQKTEKVDRNLAYIYNPNATYIHPRYMVYHKNDSVSELFISINTAELLFTMDHSSGQMESSLAFHYQVYQASDTGDRMLADSGKYQAVINKQIAGKEYIIQIPFRAIQGYSYTVRLFMYDLMRNYWLQSFLPVNKTTTCAEPYFRVISLRQRMYVFNHCVLPADSCRIETRHIPGSKKFYVCYFKPFERYHRVGDAGFAPWILKNEDSCWTVIRTDSLVFTFPREGNYLVKADSACPTGLLVHQFGEDYPEIRTVRKLAEPLCYLASMDDYRRILSSSSMKMAVDEFWLKAGGDEQTARRLIRVYYNRVKYANLYFLSDREGWKTDRGMIYILFGPPLKLYKSDNEEKWIYSFNNAEVSFTFRKRSNPYTENDYILVIDDHTESLVDEAVERWLKGKILL